MPLLKLSKFYLFYLEEHQEPNTSYNRWI